MAINRSVSLTDEDPLYYKLYPHPPPHTLPTHTTLETTCAHVISVKDLLCKLDAPSAGVLVVVNSPQLPAGPLLFSLFLLPSLLFCLLKQTTSVPFTLRGWLKCGGRERKKGERERGGGINITLHWPQALAARGREPASGVNLVMLKCPHVHSLTEHWGRHTGTPWCLDTGRHTGEPPGV